MTTITIDRATVEQALEALENAEDHLAKPYSTDASKAVVALRAALAQQAVPVQEPYCYVYEYDGVFGMHREFYPKTYNGQKPSRTVPVYTAPPQRKPLTEEEIRDLWSWSMTAEAERTATTQQHAFTRAVERAHGIKE